MTSFVRTAIKISLKYFEHQNLSVYVRIHTYGSFLLSFKKILFEHSGVGGAAINSQIIGCALHTKLRSYDDKLLHRRREKFIRIKLLANTCMYILETHAQKYMFIGIVSIFETVT